MGTVENTEQKAVLPLHFRVSTFTTTCTTNTLQKPFGEIYIDEPVFARADLNDDNDFSDTGEQIYYLHNTQYSVHAILDTSGSIIEVYKNYQPYGSVSVYTGDGGDSDWFDGDETTGSLTGNYYLFTGRRYDPEADLMFYRNRMYSTSRGRFLQRDPIGYVDGLNLYRAYFVPGGVDPKGKLSEEGLQNVLEEEQELAEQEEAQYNRGYVRVVTTGNTEVDWDQPGAFTISTDTEEGIIYGENTLTNYTQGNWWSAPEKKGACCVKPTKLNWSRNDRVRTFEINMVLNAEFTGGLPKDVLVLYRTCLRTNYDEGIIVGCTNKTSCPFNTRGFGSYVTSVMIRYYSCENNEWTIKIPPALGITYEADFFNFGDWHDASIDKK